jgi:uncharacterized protein (TIRG00374 family)
MSYVLTHNSLLPKDPSAATKRRTDLYIMAALFILFAIGLIGMAAATGWQETWDQLKMLSLLQIFALLSLSMVNYIFRGIRWHLFSTRLGLNLLPRHNVLHFVAGFAMTITPGRLGELVRLRWIHRMTGVPVTRITPLPLVDRAFDMAAMGLVLAGALVVANAGISGAAPVATLAIGTAIIVTRPVILAWIITRIHKVVGKWSRVFANLRQAARSMKVFGKYSTAVPALILSLIGWLAEGVSLFLLLKWMGADISLSMAIVIFVFSTLAGGLTGAPGGIGGAEAAMIFLLTINNVPMAISIPATAVIRVTSLWFAILIGLVTFPIAERLSRKTQIVNLRA